MSKYLSIHVSTSRPTNRNYPIPSRLCRRLMKDLSEALNGRGKTVDKLQIHLQELLVKLQVNVSEWLGHLFILFYLGGGGGIEGEVRIVGRRT